MIISFSIIFSAITVIGNIVYQLMCVPDKNVFIELIKVKNIIIFIGLFNAFLIALINIIPKILNYKLKNNKKRIKNNKILFIAIFAIIIISWLPYLLTYYPGILTPDSISELNTIINNFSSISNHHPVLHMLFVSVPFKIGYKLFKNYIIGVACSSILQMITMSAIFSYFIVFLHKRNINYKILILVLLFYAILPMHGYYSITMWKDIIFAGTTLLLSIEILKIIEKYRNGDIKFKNLILFILISVLCIFLRNNAIYMYLLLAILMLIVLRKKRKLLLLSFGLVFSVYFIVQGPVFNYFNVTKSSSAEYIAIPLQQIGRMAYKEVEFSGKEKELIEQVIPINVMKNTYTPYTSDGIKFNKNFNIKEFDKNKNEYFKLWLNLIAKHPSIAIESYLMSTLGYWYPSVNYWSVADYVEVNNYGIAKMPRTDIFSKILPKLESRNMPFFNIEWSIGLCFWIIWLFVFITMKKRKGCPEYILVYVPVIGIWLTMLIATPVFSEFRYIYSAYTTLPLLLLVPFVKNEISSPNNKNK